MIENFNARQFIYANYPKCAEAIDNGYDIRADENEWMEMMEAYAKYKNQVTNNYYLSVIKSARDESVRYFPDTVRIHGLLSEVIETNTMGF